MNQINSGFSSIEQMTSQLLQNKTPKTYDTSNTKESFEQILLQKEYQAQHISSRVPLRFSKHANERLSLRNIDLSEEQVKRLEAGAAKAQQKGITESLVMVDEYAFIVNTRSNVVVTAVTSGDDKVFTNIDGAVIG